MNPYAQKSGIINQVSSKHESPQPAVTRQPTPAEALELRIKLPWDDKVQRMFPTDLTKDLFLKLDEYGLTRTSICAMFRDNPRSFFNKLEYWGIPPAPRGGPNKAARSGNLEKPAPIFTLQPRKPGQSIAQAEAATKTEEDMDAELADVERNLADRGCKSDENYSKKYSQKAAEIIPDSQVPALDLSGWEEFGGADQPARSSSKCLTIGNKIYIGRGVKLAGWERCTILVSPDGKRVALRRAKPGIGAKIQGEGQRTRAIVCKRAYSRIRALNGGGKPKFDLQDATPELLVFAKGEAS